jgi:lipoprotein-anchoring transpeptidase ErfK/SrfK
MRRMICLSAGIFAGLIACSTGASALPDIGIFSYPPATDNYADESPVAAPIPRETVAYDGAYKAGSVVVDTGERRLYFILPDHQAIKYAIGVGRPGFEWSGVSHIAMKREWPDWTPPAQMLKRRPDLPAHMEGGIDNPLGARAMYVAGTLYRIHGSNEPDTIGQAVSSGCIRMTNDDVTDLYERVKVGATVVVLQGAPREAEAEPTE